MPMNPMKWDIKSNNTYSSTPNQTNWEIPTHPIKCATRLKQQMQCDIKSDNQNQEISMNPMKWDTLNPITQLGNTRNRTISNEVRH